MIGYEIRRFFAETLPRKIAWKLPKRIVMWACYRMFAYATSTEKYQSAQVDAITFFQAIEEWTNDRH